jgi:dynein heavy chain
LKHSLTLYTFLPFSPYQGLPSDIFSIENGVLVNRCNRWPLMIDPQGQANIWVKAMCGADLKVIDFKQKDYMTTIEHAVSHGWQVLLQDIGEEIDPSIDPVLRVTQLADAQKTIRMGEKELSYDSSFRLYITTKMQNPHYKPEVSTKTTVVNFAVKEKGLQDQLLALVVNKEEPKLEGDKAELIQTVAAGKRKLVELEDQILTLLKTSGADLLDDEGLINALQQSKATSIEVKEKLRVSEETKVKIDAAREGYRPCAVRAALLFFVLNDLSLVDPMYQFSLKAYMALFTKSIVDSKDTREAMITELGDRIETVNSHHTEAVYKYTCRALFEKHKLLFAFQMCIQKLRSDGRVNQAEYDFFLRGGQVLDRNHRMPNPCSDWLDEQTWDQITCLEKLPAFKNLAHSLEQNSSEWRAWYRSEDPPPEKLSPPGEWQSKRTEFQTMLILRCLRPDRVVFAARSFIAANLGHQFIETPPFNLQGCYHDSDALTPLIFVLSPGVDPSPILVQLAKQQGKHLEILALGQGQAPIAMDLLEQGVSKGNWVFLANAHLSMSWLPDLEKFVEQLSLRKTPPHPNFRLWLSSDPSPRFPISLLQQSVKMTTEPPKGLKANLLRLYENLTPEQFAMCKRAEKYKKLLFALCFFHAVLVERRKFLSLGWNVVYSFNDSDFGVCENLLSLYLDQYDDTPWDALKYLIAQANYGGRVTDEHDRRLLTVYINQFFQVRTITLAVVNQCLFLPLLSDTHPLSISCLLPYLNRTTR